MAAVMARKGGRKWKRVLSWLILVPWALPGNSGCGLNCGSLRSAIADLGSFILVGTFWILPVVYFLRFMPLVVRALAGEHGTTGCGARGSGKQSWAHAGGEG